MEDTKYTPRGPTRPREIYISRQHWQALNYIAQTSIDPELSTREGIIAQVLEMWLKVNHPKIVEWIDKREADEKAFLKSIRPQVPFT